MNISEKKLKIGNLSIDVIQKDIKNIHLSVHPPTGRVRISAPSRLKLDTIRVFAISKLSWIKKQQQKFKDQVREAPREYINRESHYYGGKRYLLKVIEQNSTPKVILKHNNIELYVRPGSNIQKKHKVLQEWYRDSLKDSIPKLINKWERRLKVKLNEFGIKRMRTRWGTCNPLAKRMWINLELAKKPPECLEFIVVHEMVHLIERKHNDRFITLMDQFIPKWRFYRDELNRIPIKHEDWKY